MHPGIHIPVVSIWGTNEITHHNSNIKLEFYNLHDQKHRLVEAHSGIILGAINLRFVLYSNTTEPRKSSAKGRMGTG